MFCGNCGERIENDAIFCGNCGAAAENEKTAKPEQPAVQSYSSALTKKKGSLLPLIIILILVVVVSGGAIWFMLARNSTVPEMISPKIEEQAKKEDVADSSSPTPQPTLAAADEPAPVLHPAPIFSMTSASNVTAAAEGRNYSPYLVQDGQPDTAWSFTGTSNEWIMISSETEQYVSEIKILNGYTKYSSDYGFWVYYRNNRPKDVTISFSDGSSVNMTLEDVFDESNYHYQSVPLDEPKLTKFIKVTINSVYAGDRWNDTCISEIQVN